MWKLLLSILETNYAELMFFFPPLFIAGAGLVLHSFLSCHRQSSQVMMWRNKEFQLERSFPTFYSLTSTSFHSRVPASLFLKNCQHLIFISWKQPCQHLFQTYKIISMERSQACPLISQNQRAVFHSSHLTFLVISLLLRLPWANWVTQNHKYYHSAISNVYFKVPDF